MLNLMYVLYYSAFLPKNKILLTGEIFCTASVFIFKFKFKLVKTKFKVKIHFLSCIDHISSAWQSPR